MYSLKLSTFPPLTMSSYKNLECAKKPRRKKVVAQYDLSGELIKEFSSLRSACKNVYNNENFKEGVKACCEEKTLNYRGYIWKYVDKEN